MNPTTGDTVEWTSQAAGSTKTKRGLVVWSGPKSWETRAQFSAYRDDMLPVIGWADDAALLGYIASPPSRRMFDRVNGGILVKVPHGRGFRWYAPRVNKSMRVVTEAIHA